jgi:hypothetical protein
MMKQVQSREELFIQFTDEEIEKLGLENNQKLSMEILENGSIKMTPFAKIDIDITEWSREVLENLIQESVEQDISVNEVISQTIEQYLKNHEQ